MNSSEYSASGVGTVSINALGVVTVPIDLALSVFEVAVEQGLTNDEVLRHNGLKK